MAGLGVVINISTMPLGTCMHTPSHKKQFIVVKHFVFGSFFLSDEQNWHIFYQVQCFMKTQMVLLVY